MADLSNPILNGPYDPPSQFFEIGAQGPTGVVVEGRRPSNPVDATISVAGSHARTDRRPSLGIAADTPQH